MSDSTVDPTADWYAGLSKASQGGGGNHINAGVYDLEVVKLLRKIGAGTKTKGHKLNICEFRIAKVITAFAESDGFAASNAEGEYVSVICDLDSEWAYMDEGRLRGIVEACVGALPNADIPAATTAAFHPGNPLAGTVIRCVATRKTTKAGKRIAGTVFQALPPEE